MLTIEMTSYVNEEDLVKLFNLILKLECPMFQELEEGQTLVKNEEKEEKLFPRHTVPNQLKTLKIARKRETYKKFLKPTKT
jgi:hypothetical protein